MAVLTIEEVIEKLQKTKNEKGNVEVQVYDYNYCAPESITTIKMSDDGLTLVMYS